MVKSGRRRPARSTLLWPEGQALARPPCNSYLWCACVLTRMSHVRACGPASSVHHTAQAGEGDAEMAAEEVAEGSA